MGAAERERGWGLVLLALAAALAVTLTPAWPGAAGQAAALLRLLAPVEQTLLLVIPAVAACTVVGWWAGGRGVLALGWLGLMAWQLALRTGADGSAATAGYSFAARGWGVVLAASFGLVSIAAPRRPFLTRALGALALAFTVTLGTLLVGGRDPGRVGRLMTAEYARRVEGSLGAWRRHATRDATFRDVAGRAPEVSERAQATAARLAELPPTAARLTPALLALESLAALALAWALYHRLSRTRLGPPLGALRQFRFNDQLVWGLVLGATFVLVPTLRPLRPVGANLLVFFGALYALRGLGVLRWLAPERVAALVALGLALLVPVLGVALVGGAVGGLALALGLADGWSDWRRRAGAVG